MSGFVFTIHNRRHTDASCIRLVDERPFARAQVSPNMAEERQRPRFRINVYLLLSEVLRVAYVDETKTLNIEGRPPAGTDSRDSNNWSDLERNGFALRFRMRGLEGSL